MSRAAQGLRAWLLQRFTAIYLALYLVSFVSFITLRGSFSHAEWRTWMGEPWLGVTTALFAVALLLHAWVGFRDVLIDYVHAVWLRLSLLAITAVLLAGSLFWVLRALIVAAIGSHG
ncbi:succinate dehydrogenase, hydrophobic membrane anchor protein [Thiogranum longum]